MSVTELRDDQASEWRSWSRRNPDKAREHASRRQRRLQEATAPHAVNDGKPWAEEELAQIMRSEPILDIALRLGRTYKSVVRARQRRRQMLGLGIEYTKSEADEYDGSDRRGVLYAKDKK